MKIWDVNDSDNEFWWSDLIANADKDIKPSDTDHLVWDSDNGRIIRGDKGVTENHLDEETK